MDKTLLTLYSLIVKDNKIQDVGTPLHANDANFGARIVRPQSQCVLVVGALCWAWVLQVVGTDWLHHYCSTVQLYTPN